MSELREEMFSKWNPELIKELNIKLPPNSAVELNSNFKEYIQKKSLVVEFVVQEKHTNPLGLLQGGILCAYFDDTFGPLCYAVIGKPILTLEMNTQFIRSAKVNEKISVKAEFVSRGVQVAFLKAEAFNQKNKLIATATTTVMILNQKLD
jgi:uncharacterized protein (TIGR00369 family)